MTPITPWDFSRAVNACAASRRLGYPGWPPPDGLSLEAHTWLRRHVACFYYAVREVES